MKCVLADTYSSVAGGVPQGSVTGKMLLGFVLFSSVFSSSEAIKTQFKSHHNLLAICYHV